MKKMALIAIASLLLLLAAASAQKSDGKNDIIADGFAGMGNGTANQTVNETANLTVNQTENENAPTGLNKTAENPTGTGYGGADIGTGGAGNGNQPGDGTGDSGNGKPSDAGGTGGGAELGGGKGEGAPPVDGGAGELGVDIYRSGPMVEVEFDNVLHKKGTFYSGIIRATTGDIVYFEVNQSGGGEREDYPPTVAAMIMPEENPKPEPGIAPNPSNKPTPQMKPESLVRKNYDVWYSLPESQRLYGTIAERSGPGDDSFARVTVEVTCASASEGSRCSFQYPLMYNGEFRVDALDSRGRLVGRESRWVEIAYATRETFYVNGVGKLLASMSTGQLVFYHHDYLGNVVRKTDLSGAVVASTEYKPFGEILSETGESRYKYNSKELDSQIGLYYYGSRYYDAAIGRFTTADTLKGTASDPQSLNRYAYVKNNPMRFVDPTGNAADEPNPCEDFTTCEPDNTKVAEPLAGGPLPSVPSEWTGRESGLVEPQSNELAMMVLTGSASLPLKGGLAATAKVGKAMEMTLFEKEGVATVKLGVGKLSVESGRLGVDIGVDGVSGSADILNIPGKLKVGIEAGSGNGESQAAGGMSGTGYLAAYQQAFAESTGWADARARFLMANLGNPNPGDSMINGYQIRSETVFVQGGGATGQIVNPSNNKDTPIAAR